MVPATLSHRLAGLRSDTSGLALVEFALSLPVLLIMGMMGLETANFALANLRCSQMAMLAADNAGRVRISIDEADMNDVMTGTKLMGNGIRFAANGRIIISDLERRTTNNNTTPTTVTVDNPNGYRQWIRWQRCSGNLNATSSFGGPIDSSGAAVTNLNNNTNADHGAVEDKSVLLGMGNAANRITAAGGTAVMFVEVVYNYQPIVPISYLGARTLRYTSAFNVRQRTQYTITNSGSLSGAGRSDCTLYSA